VRPGEAPDPEFDVMALGATAAGTESSLVLPCCAGSRKTAASSPTTTSASLAAYIGVPRIQIEEVLSHYTQFRRAPDRALAPAGPAATCRARCAARGR